MSDPTQHEPVTAKQASGLKYQVGAVLCGFAFLLSVIWYFQFAEKVGRAEMTRNLINSPAASRALQEAKQGEIFPIAAMICTAGTTLIMLYFALTIGRNKNRSADPSQ